MNDSDGISPDSTQTSMVDYGNEEKGSNLILQEGQNVQVQESTEDCLVQDDTEISHVILEEAAELCLENAPAPNPETVLEHQGAKFNL